MGIEVEPKYVVEKSKFFNRLDEEFGMLCLTISRGLLFHVDNISTPNEVWINIETFLENIDEMRGH